MSILVHKRYLLDKKPFLKHFYPRDVALTAVRSILIPGVQVFEGFVNSLQLEESSSEEDSSSSSDDSDDDDAEHAAAVHRRNGKPRHVRQVVAKSKPEDEWEPPSKEEFGRDCAIAFTKSMSVTTCVRSMEAICLRVFRPQIVDKLIKDVSKSATRKFVRYSSRFSAAIHMVKTGMRANILSHLAIFIVEEAQQVIVILYKWYAARKAAAKLPPSHKKRIAQPTEQPKFLQLTLHNASRSCLAIVTGGVGAAVGTMIRPGFGTFVGATLGDSIAYVI